MKVNHRDFLPAVLEVQETPPSPLGRVIMWVIMVLLVLAVSWSALSDVDIVAVTRGKLAVSRLSRPVHSAVTAEIQEVLVQEGMVVKKGQPLVRLNSGSLLAQLEEKQLRQQINTFHIARLGLLSEHYADNPAEATLPKELLEQSPLLGLPIQKQLLAEIASDKQEKSVYQNNYQILQSQQDAYQEQLSMAKKLLPIYTEQYVALEKLYKTKAGSRDSLLEIHKKLLEARHNVTVLEARVREAGNNIAKNRVELDARISEKIRQAEQSRTELINENALLSSQIKQLEALLKQYTLVSPVNGKVESLVFRDAGAAVEAPQEVLKIVPEGEKLNAEVLVSNQDVGFLRVGQMVTVKVDAFDFTRYGWVEGELKHLSADAIEDKELGLVYKAVIELKSDMLKVEGRSKKLEPGMSVTAEIKTGKRTILSYLLSPMLEALDDVGKQR